MEDYTHDDRPAPTLKELEAEREELKPKLDRFRKELGVDPGADAAAIKAAYRKLSMQHHPDKGGSTTKCSKINAARDGLLRAPELEQLLGPAQPSRRSRLSTSGPPAEVPSADAQCPDGRCERGQQDDGCASGYRCRKCGWEILASDSESDSESDSDAPSMPKRGRPASSSPEAKKRRVVILDSESESDAEPEVQPSRDGPDDSDDDGDSDDSGDDDGEDGDEDDEMQGEDEFTLTEEPDMAKLEWLLRHPEVKAQHRKRLKQYYDAAKAQGGKVTVTYRRTNQGRYYPVTAADEGGGPLGLVATFQSRLFRATLFADGHLDIDIFNCHPMLLRKLARDCIAIDAHKYALLNEYCNNREAIFTREALPKDAAKELLCTVMFGGSVDRFRSEYDDKTGYAGPISDWWLAFVREIKKLMRLVLRHAVPAAEIASIKNYLQSAAYKAKHPDKVRANGTVKVHDGMVLSQVLMRRERKEVIPFMEELERRLGHPAAFYAYDGVAFKAGNRADTIETVEALLEEWNTEDVRFVIKPFGPQLVRPKFQSYQRRTFMGILSGKLKSLKSLAAAAAEEEDGFDSDAGKALAAAVAAVQLDMQLYWGQYAAFILGSNGCQLLFEPDGNLDDRQAPQSMPKAGSNFAGVMVPTCGLNKKGRVTLSYQNHVDNSFWNWIVNRADRPEYNAFRFAPPGYPGTFLPNWKNRWRGFRIESVPGLGRLITDEDVETFLYQALMLGEDSDEGQNRLLDHYAADVQHPGGRTGCIVVLTGRQGSGKSLLGEFMDRMYFHENVLNTADMKMITGRFSQVANKSRITIEESKAKDAVEGAAAIKNLATTVVPQPIDVKYQNPENQQIVASLTLVNNHPDRKSVDIEPSDRRTEVFKPCEKHIGDQAYFDRLWPWLQDDQNLRNVFDWLRQRDLSSYLDAQGRLNMGEFQRRRYISETYKSLQQLCTPDMDGFITHMARLVVYGDRHGHSPWESEADEDGDVGDHPYRNVLEKPTAGAVAAWSSPGVKIEDLWDLYRKFLESIKSPFPKESLQAFIAGFDSRVSSKAWHGKERVHNIRYRTFDSVGLVEDRLAGDPDALALLAEYMQ